ncbi:MAG: hypothetical protein WDN24_10300 [Sphingomonas sp.]
MSRYQPLADFLAAQKSDRWDASFAEIEARLGFPLPKSAHSYPAWWANQSGGGHSQTTGWRSVGWRTAALDLAAKRVRFEREGPLPPAQPDNGNAALIARAGDVTGIQDRDRIVEEALKALIAREAGARLARLGGSMPDYRAPSRERPGA